MGDAKAGPTSREKRVAEHGDGSARSFAFVGIFRERGGLRAIVGLFARHFRSNSRPHNNFRDERSARKRPIDWGHRAETSPSARLFVIPDKISKNPFNTFVARRKELVVRPLASDRRVCRFLAAKLAVEAAN
jgi:hypothetical protein